ncbi:MAG TPA: hypothetical protein VHW23_31285 [Kofleriaceae bacterium]|nr:hypothetical protein [Kofleriaceae bacterium]
MKLFPALLLTIVPAMASAQLEPVDTVGWGHAVAAVPDRTFEIAVATGYAQGGGKLGGDLHNLEDVAGPGAAVEVDVGARIIPQLTVGVYGTLAKSQHGDQLPSSTDVLGASAGVQAAWHFRSDTSLDPWVSLGGGWRALWLDPSTGKTTSLQGVDLARVQVGLDYRVSPEIAISPVIGGSASMFVSQDSPMTTSYTEISDKQVNFTGFVGLSGRFDFGNKKSSDASAARNDAALEAWQ